jgi:GNAT superfamily N-acetyltransferase
MIAPSPITLRTAARESDSHAVRVIVASTGFFSAEEIAIAVELIDDRIAHGDASHYQFIFADDSRGESVGYTCYGRITGTAASFDLYWIAVRNDQRGKGIGRLLMQESERRIAQAAGRANARVYVETSSRAQYEPTRQFYLRNGYAIASSLDDFYAPGDGKVTLVKVL